MFIRREKKKKVAQWLDRTPANNFITTIFSYRSPFECPIRNTSVSVTGNGIKMSSVNVPVTFAIGASKEETRLYDISVLSPSGIL